MLTREVLWSSTHQIHLTKPWRGKWNYFFGRLVPFCPLLKLPKNSRTNRRQSRQQRYVCQFFSMHKAQSSANPIQGIFCYRILTIKGQGGKRVKSLRSWPRRMHRLIPCKNPPRKTKSAENDINIKNKSRSHTRKNIKNLHRFVAKKTRKAPQVEEEGENKQQDSFID